MATAIKPQAFTSKVRFAHRYKMVTHKSANPERVKEIRRFEAEAPDAGFTRRAAEAGEMWARNAEASESRYC